MNTRAIDYITEDLYESLSFMDGEQPDFDTVRSLFYDDGLLINNTFNKPYIYTVQSFTESIEEQVNDGRLQQYMQRELYSKTEVFGKVAQRISVYQYSFVYHEVDNAPKGVNYMNFVQVEDNWLIASMAWCDESANNRIPEELLGGA